MSARPALTLVPAPPRPGPRALEFIRWAIDTFGDPAGEPGRVLVHHTQTELVAHHDTISSDGTVTRYMGQLRAAGIVVGARPISVDLDALAAAAGGQRLADRATSTVPDDGGVADSRQPGPPAVSVAELLAQRAEQQARLAQLQAELDLTDVAIACALTDPEPDNNADHEARDLASRALANRERFREFRDPGLAIQEIQTGRKEHLDNSPSFLARDIASRDREPRESSRTRRQSPP